MQRKEQKKIKTFGILRGYWGDVYRYEDTETNAPLVGMDADVQIDHLVLENISQTCRPGLNPPLIDNKATVKTLVVRD